MKVLADLTFIVPGRNRGAETYVNALLAELRDLPGLDVACLTNRLNQSRYRDEMGLECHASGVHGGNRTTRFAYQQAASAFVARRTGADVLFCPGNLSPLFPSVPTVSVVHDMNFRDIPGSVPLGRRLVFGMSMPFAVRSAARLITPSQYSRRRIMDVLGVGGDKVVVVHEGPPAERDMLGADDWKVVSRKYGIRGDFFLSVSSGLPHKNIGGLLRGFVEMKKRHPGGQQLVLVGHGLSGELESYLDREAVRGDVVATGYVSDGEKWSFLKNALAYVFPSLYEGFGLPALEAQACGVPVAASRHGSLPEICGEGALYFDALSVESIAHALRELGRDAALREGLVRKGCDNLSRFSWRRAAMETGAVLRGAAESGARMA